jgi:hypothetical protein
LYVAFHFACKNWKNALCAAVRRQTGIDGSAPAAHSIERDEIAKHACFIGARSRSIDAREI